jgi:hypothetical protein
MRSGSKDDPELRKQAEEMLDQARELRRKIDNLRIEERAKEKLKEI